MNSIFKVPLFAIGFLDQELAALIRVLFLQQISRDELLNNRIKISNRDLDDVADVNQIVGPVRISDEVQHINHLPMRFFGGDGWI
jgi:hypothetical protein